MRALLWTLLGSSLFFGFVSLVVAAEGADVASTDNADDVSADPIEPDAGVDGGNDLDGGIPPGPPPPPPPPPPPVDESSLAPLEPPEELPYAKGTMEISLGLSLSGNGSENFFGVSGRYAYYMWDKAAPGIDIRYTHVFVDDDADYEYPESLTLLPFAKYVLTQKAVAPYVMVTGGYEAEWGADNAVNAWILGLGGGVHITVAKRIRINIELTALHYWYSKPRVYWYEDDSQYSVKENTDLKVFKSDCERAGDACRAKEKNETIPNEAVILVDSNDKEYICTDDNLCNKGTHTDKTDKEREWFFPLISVGIGVVF